MQRYLLFDSSCSLCTSIARRVEDASDDRLTARSLRDPEVRSILDEVKPGWRWEPMLLEVDGERRRVYVGLGMRLRLVQALGPRRALRLARIVQQATVFQSGRRGALKQLIGVVTGIMFAGQAAKSLAADPEPGITSTSVFLPLVSSESYTPSTSEPWRIPSAVGPAASDLGVTGYSVIAQTARTISIRFSQKGRSEDEEIHFEHVDTGLSMILDRGEQQVTMQWQLQSGELSLSSSQGDKIHFELDFERHQFIADDGNQRELARKYRDDVALIGAIGQDFWPILSTSQDTLCERCRSSASSATQRDKINSICCGSYSVSGSGWGWTRSQACFNATNDANVKCWNSLCVGCCSLLSCDCACFPDMDFLCWCRIDGAPCINC